MKYTQDHALKKGIEAHKAGKAQEADRYYTAILKANPKHPDANHNMGVLAVGLGKVETALPFFKRATEVNPKIAQYWLSYIDSLIELDRISDAKAVLDQAKSKSLKGDGFDQIEEKLGFSSSKNLNAQEPSKEQLQSLVHLYSQGQYKEALNKGFQLLEQFPNSINLYNIVGAIYNGLGKLEEAIEAYSKAISIKPDYADAYYNMGNALKEQGKLEEAMEAYSKAISIKPDYAEAYNNMGNALQDQGKLEDAIEAFDKALSIKPNYAEAFNNMGNMLTGITLNKPNGNLQKTIVSLLNKERYVRPNDIAKAAISLLKFEPQLQKHLQMVDAEVIKSPLDIILNLNEFPLLLKLMSVCPLPDLELEGLLTNLRFAILLNVLSLEEASPDLLSFQSALALQCFTNEYIYNHTDEEEKILKSLDASVRKTLANKNQPSPQIILALASYNALNKYDWYELLVLTDHLKEVFTRQILEHKEEEKLKKNLPILKEITDSVSSEVRAQYEESPYPRWVNLKLALKPISISKMAGEIKIKLQRNSIAEVEKPEILIAGCGTGQHSIGTSTFFKSSRVIAVDLSLSSLAYAKRKTEELGIENIKYLQANILDLGQLNKQFDIIESAGVLHHMNEPIEGWKVLTDCLKPGGLMRIGLYSKIARQHILKIRQEISKSGIGSSNAEMKSFRATVMTSEQNHYKRILNAQDFYSLSTLRDLLFHVEEHLFTIPKIKDHLDTLGLKFCGFETQQVVSHFTQTNKAKDDPYDLDKWQVYEEANPQAFAGMYQFWCQKVD